MLIMLSALSGVSSFSALAPSRYPVAPARCAGGVLERHPRVPAF
jgi:hypothetical protein